ncbi:hypothetical protein [Streptomyces longisporus]
MSTAPHDFDAFWQLALDDARHGAER